MKKYTLNDLIPVSEGSSQRRVAPRETFSMDDLEPVGGALSQQRPAQAISTGEEPSSDLGRRIADYGVSAFKGVIDTGEAAVGLADLASGSRGENIHQALYDMGLTKTKPHKTPTAGELLEETTGYDPQKTQESLDELYSEEQQEINKKVEQAEGFWGTTKEMIKHPSSIAHEVTRSLPATMGGGAIGRTMGMPLIGGAIGEGAIQAGGSAEEFRQEKGGLSSIDRAIAVGSGIGTAAIAAAGGRLAQKLGIEDIDTMLARSGSPVKSSQNVAKRIIGGGITEGVFEELPQSSQEQIWSNAAFGRPLLEGVGKAGATGMMTGAGMGAGANVKSAGVDLMKNKKQPPQTPEGDAGTTIDQEAPATDVQKIASQLADDISSGAYNSPEAARALRAELTNNPEVASEVARELEKREKAQGQEQGPVDLLADRKEQNQAKINEIWPSETEAQPETPSGQTTAPLAGAIAPQGATPAISPESPTRLDTESQFPAAMTPEQRQAEIEAAMPEDGTMEVEGQVPGATQAESEVQPDGAPSAQEENRQAWKTRKEFDGILARTDSVQEARDLARQMAEQNYTDPLLGIKNKASWIERQIDEKDMPDDQKSWKAMYDIDNFSWYNDALGHELGDKILSQVGQVLKEEAVDPHRYGGEEIGDIGGNDAAAHNQLSQAAERVRERLDKEVKFEYTLLEDVTLDSGEHYKKGDTIVVKGLGVSYGLGKTPEQADQGLKRDKSARTKEGLRSPKSHEAKRVYRKVRGGGLKEGGARPGIESIPGRDRIRSLSFPEIAEVAKRAKIDLTPAKTTQDAIDIIEVERNRYEQSVAQDKPTVEPTTDEAAAAADTSPTLAQIEAGNYKKGHVSYEGMDISIENPQGSTRKGTDQDGNKWETTLNHHYGYLRKTLGKDKDQIDAFIKPGTESSPKVFVVDQVDAKTGEFDEHKVMLGFDNKKEAREAYLSNYEEGWQGLGSITETDLDTFKSWAYDGRKTKRFAEPTKKQKSLDEYNRYINSLSKVDKEAAADLIETKPESPGRTKLKIQARLKQVEKGPAGKTPAPAVSAKDEISPATEPGDILTNANEPFKTKGAANLALKSKKLQTTHEPIQVGEKQWVIREKSGQEAEAAPEPETEATPIRDKAVIGKAGTTYLPDNTPVEFEYAVAEAGDVTVSHDPDFTKNDNFPKELQPRGRDREAMRIQAIQMSENLIPAKLGESSSLTGGAPMVGPDGVVESGNGRAWAVRRAYKEEAGSDYKQWLADNAESFGLDAATVEKLNAPVLIRIRKTEVADREGFTRKANESETAAMSPLEQAEVDAQALTEGDLSIFNPTEEGEINGAGNQEFIKRFLNKMGIGARAEYVTADGAYTRQLIDRIRAAVFHAAYKNTDITQLVAESTDPEIKNLLNGLLVAAPKFTRLRGQDNSLGGTKVDQHIVDAVDYIRLAKREHPGMSLAKAVKNKRQQSDMFETPLPAEADHLVSFLTNNTRSAKKIGRIFKKIGDRLKVFLDEKQYGDNLIGGASEFNALEEIENAVTQANDQEADTLLGFAGRDQESGRSGEQGASERSGRDRAPSEEAGEVEETTPAAAPEATEEASQDILIRKPSPRERKGGTVRSRALAEIPAKEGYEAVYKPYGNTGDTKDAGFYYTPAKSQKGAAPIDDFGEVLEGARKHYAEKLQDSAKLDTAKEPLSKTWPEPDYNKLIEEGAAPEAVAYVRALRDMVPTKGRSSWKVNRYTQAVESLRDLAQKILDGEISISDLQDTLSQPDFNNIEKQLNDTADLYQAVGHKHSLKGVRISEGRYTVYNGEKLDKPKTVWTVEKKAKATVWGNFPTELAQGKTREEAIKNFTKKADQVLGTESQKKKGIRFGIYKNLEDKKIYIGKKYGTNRYVDLESFDSVAAARKYLAENQEALEKKLEKAKNFPSERKTENAPRVGEDHLQGRDATPDMFTEAFGFRGVQFGNYVEQSKRQEDLNETYNALMDMAGVLGIPARSISLNGELGLAFGARGKGGKEAPSAHYEPGTVVINLTKKRGAGSLAHEWWHALDNYFGRARGKKGFFTDRPYTLQQDGTRPEMVEAFSRIMRVVRKSGLPARSMVQDKTRSKKYWSEPTEMSARAFESYIVEQLHDQGGANDYLANIVDQEVWDAAAAMGFEQENSYPYPTREEIPDIRAAFQNFFDIIESRETEQGVALFQKTEATTAGLPLKKLRFTIAGLAKGFRQLPGLNYVQSEADLPAHIQDRIRQKNAQGEVAAVFDQGEVYFVADNIKSVEAARSAFLHEVFGHHGLESLLGKMPAMRFYRQLHEAKKDTAEYRKIADDYELDLTNRTDQVTAAREYAAKKAESGVDDSWVTKLVGMIRDALRKLGIQMQISDNDIRRLIAAGAGQMKGEGVTVLTPDTTAFSKMAARWYSEMERTLADKLPNKGSGKSYSNTIQAWANKGQIKHEELEWSGLVEWLNDQGKLTKGEVLDWLAENNVRVEEVVKGGESAFDPIPEGSKYEGFYDNGNWESYPVEITEDAIVLGENYVIGIENTTGNVIEDDEGQFWYYHGDDLHRSENRPSTDQVFGEAHANDDTKFSEYQTPGGENYKELLITMPPKQKQLQLPEGWTVEKATSSLGETVWNVRNKTGEMVAGGVPSRQRAIEVSQGMTPLQAAEEMGDYTSSHWSEPNVLAHIRMNERTGPNGERVLFVEEMQSDWHQAGRKKGYQEKHIPEIGDRFSHDRQNGEGPIDFTRLPDPAGKESKDHIYVRDEFQSEYYLPVSEIRKIEGVPDAPFKKNWSLLAMKRIVRYAAENGFDTVAWTPGEVQAERYDLSRHLSEISAQKRDDSPGWSLTAKGPSGDTAIDADVDNDSKLADYVGKEMADRIIADGGGVYSGLDLKVGGEGMKGFYDKILPAAVNKFFGKAKWGKAKVGEVEISREGTPGKIHLGGERSGQMVKEGDRVKVTTAHALPVTEEMKSKALTEGMPLFQFAGRKALGATQLDQAQQMKEQGDTREQIWKDTGWWEITPGQWSFEIDDSKAYLKKPFPEKGQLWGHTLESAMEKAYSEGRLNLTVEGILSHTTLFEQYPEIADISVGVKAGDGASYVRPTGREPARIEVGKDVEMADFKSVLVHEVQHAIQEYEGFARGGNTETAGPGKGAVPKEIKELYNKLVDEIQPVQDEYIKLKRDMSTAELMETYTYQKYDAMQRELNALSDRIQNESRMNAYRTLTGEVEARLTQRRMDMTSEQRKTEPPWETMEKMLREEGLLEEGQSPEDVLATRHDGDVAAMETGKGKGDITTEGHPEGPGGKERKALIEKAKKYDSADAFVGENSEREDLYDFANAMGGDYDVFVHGGTEKTISEIKTGSMFDGLFASPGTTSFHGKYDHPFIIDKRKIARRSDIDLDYDKSIEFLKSEYPDMSEADIDRLYELAAEDTPIEAGKNPLAEQGFRDNDEAAWEAQRLRGQIASDQGYDAVAVDDEHGTSYLIPSGSKAINYNQHLTGLWNKANAESERQGPLFNSTRPAEEPGIDEPVFQRKKGEGSDQSVQDAINPVDPEAAAAGKEAIDKIMARLEKVKAKESKVTVSETQARKLAGDYLKLRDKIMSDAMDTEKKIKEFKAFLMGLPPAVRAKAMAGMPKLTMARTPETRQKYFEEAQEQAQQYLSRYFKMTLRRDIHRLRKKPKKNEPGAVKKSRLGPEGQETLELINSFIFGKNPIRTNPEALSSLAAINHQRAQLKEEQPDVTETRETEKWQNEMDMLDKKAHLIQVFGGINDMSIDELQNAYDELNHILETGRTRWMAMEIARKAETDRLRVTMAQDITGEEAPVPETAAEKQNRLVRERESTIHQISSKLNQIDTIHQSWRFLMDKLSRKGEGGTLQTETVKQIGGIPHHATSRENMLNITATDMMNEKLAELTGKKKRALRQWIDEQSETRTGYSIKKPDGATESISLAPMEAAYWWAIARRGRGLAREGNTAFNTRLEKMGVNDHLIEQIENNIDPKIIELATWLSDVMGEHVWQTVNPIHEARFGAKLTHSQNYTPVVADYHRGPSDDNLLQQWEQSPGMMKGALHELTRTQIGVKPKNLLEVWVDHVHDMNHFAAWALPVQTLESVFGGPEIRNFVEREHGAGMAKAIDDFIDHFKTGQKRRKEMFSFLDRLRGKFSTAVLGLNPVVYIKQMTSIPAMAADMPTGAFVSGLNDFFKSPAKNVKILNESAFIQNRFGRGHTRDVAVATAQSVGSAIAKTKSLPSQLMLLTRMGDMQAIYVGGWAVYKHHKKRYLKQGMSENEAHQEALIRFEEAARDTQQSGETMDLGLIQQAGPLPKLMTMFMTAPASYYREVSAAARAMSKDPKDATRRLMLFWVVVPAIFEGIASAPLLGGDDEDRDLFWKRMLRGMALGPANGLFIARDVLNYFWNQAFLKEEAWMEPGYAPVTAAVEKSGSFIREAAKGLEDMDFGDMMEDIIDVAGYMTGYPLPAAQNLARGWKDVAEGDTEHPVARTIGYGKYAVNE